MKEYFSDIGQIPFEGPQSREPLAFKFYDPDRLVLGKPMKEHLPFAMAWWHNLCATGVDMFGRGTADKSGGGAKSPAWRQIMADMLGIPIHIPKTEQGPAYGAARRP